LNWIKISVRMISENFRKWWLLEQPIDRIYLNGFIRSTLLSWNINYKKKYMVFFISDPLSALHCRSWYINQRSDKLDGWYQDQGLMRDLIWKRSCYELFIIYLAQENISRNWRITMWYRLQKVPERGVTYSRTMWYVCFISAR
jgi:hypothetical protein